MGLTMAQWHHRIGSQFRRLVGENSATVMTTFALAVPVVFGAVGVAVDYSMASNTRTRMQAVADAAAINGAREFQMARATASSVTAAVQSYVRSQLNDVSVMAAADEQALSVNVVVEKDVAMTIGKVVFGGKMHLRASATARVSARMPLCLLALDDKAPDTLSLEKQAQMMAANCMVYSNSTNNKGLEAKDSAIIAAGLICTAGGKYKGSRAQLTPDPVTDCPVMDNPLASRAGPSIGACNFTDMVLSNSSQTLQPGVYCGGLKVTNGAVATLSRGVYIIKDGPLIVDRGATLQGTDVGFYLTGKGSNLTFDAETTISLSAPKDGPLAGLLIFDDPTGAAAPAIPPVPLPEVVDGLVPYAKGPPREHKILSDNARLLLGTIYMPQGRLIIDANKPIADKSAYTVMVVRRIDLHDGPNLILNSDYSATDVPVPQGVGPFGKVLLTN